MFSNKSIRFKGLILVILTVIIVSMNLYPMIEPGPERYFAQSSNSSTHVNDDKSDNFESDYRALPDSIDVPTIVRGDTWTYQTDIEVTVQYDALVLDGTISGSTTFSADTIVPISANGTSYLCYKIDFGGTFSLEASWGGFANFLIDAYTQGSEYRNVADYAIVKKDSFQNGTIYIDRPWPFEDDSFEFNLTTNDTHKLPQEEYDFPLFEGEKWSQDFQIYSQNVGDFGGNPINDTTTESLSYQNSCTGLNNTGVTAGNFDSYMVEMDSGTETRYFSESVRNVVLTEINSGTFISTPDFSIDIKEGIIELVSFNVGEYGNILNINEIPAVAPNSTITVSGNIPGISTGNINIDIPGEDIFITAPISDGIFQKELYMGNRADDTQNILSIDDYWGNISDIGSHGIIIYYGNFIVHKVITATIAEPDVRVEDLSFDPFNGSIVGTPVKLNITVSNPSMVTANNLDLRLIHDEVEIDLVSVISVPALENITTTLEWTASGPVGLHQFRCELDPGQLINESREDNNEYNADYNVTDRPNPGIQSQSPEPGDISINEEDVINFNVTVEELPGGKYTKKWFFKMADTENYTLMLENSSSFQFITRYLGNSSSINSPYKFKFLVSDEAALVDRSISLEWNVTVNNINRPPVIENQVPVDAVIKINENETLNLSIEGVDIDETVPVVEWFLDNDTLGISKDFYQYQPDFNSSGFHNISVRLWDFQDPGNMSLSDYFVWNIEVENKNRYCTANIEFPLNNSIYKVGEPINFSSNGSQDPDILPKDYSSKLSYSWDFGDGLSAYGFNVNHSFEKEGSYFVELTVRDNDGGMDTYKIKLVIDPKEADTDGDGIPDSEDPDIDGDGVPNDLDDYDYDPDRQKKPDSTPVEADRLSSLYITMIFILGTGFIILIIVVSFLIIRQKKKKAEEEDAQNRGSEDLHTQVNNLVGLEDEREVILERLDKIEGKFEQLDWDLEDGYIPQERYEHLTDRYRHRRDQLKDELAEIEDQIDYIERKIERTDRRRVSKKRTYGGGGSDDFERRSYQEVEEQFDDDGKRWDEDEYWAEESEEEPEPALRRRYHDDYDEEYDEYSEYEDDEYDDYEGSYGKYSNSGAEEYDRDEDDYDEYEDEDDEDDDYEDEDDEDDYYRD